MEETTFKAYRRQVETQGKALLDVIQSVALGDLDVKIEVPEGVEVLSDLAVGVGIMVDDLREMLAERVQLQLVEQQSRALLDIVQSIALGDLDVEIEIPEGIDVLSDLAIGLEIMVDDIRELLDKQERARAELDQARQQLQQNLEEMQALQRRYVEGAWRAHTATMSIHSPELVEGQGYERSEDEERSSQERWLPTMTTALQQESAVVEHEGQAVTLALPLELYGEIIGISGFVRKAPGTWTDEEIETVEAIVEQVGLALESQRLLEEQQRASFLLGERLKDLDCLNDIGHKIDETPSVPDFLQWVAERIPPAMQYPDLCRAAIQFRDQTFGVAEALELPRQMVGGIQVGGERVGRVVIAYTEDRDFLDEESALLGDIIRRTSGYIENRYLFEQTQARARREQILREVTARVRGANDPDVIMRTAVRELGAALGRPAFVRLSDTGPLTDPDPDLKAGGE